MLEEQFLKRKEKIFSEKIKPSTLYLVPTPLGNLGDISLRSLYVLESVDKIACEDTRNTSVLLQAYGIKNTLTSFHEHNQEKALPKLLAFLSEGNSLALCTDAGTPAISDPGQILVRHCREAGFEVVSLPGPCAAITALAGSGLPSYQFTFQGFLPREKKEALEQLKSLLNRKESLVFYEAPHRFKQSLKWLIEAGFSKRKMVLARELTKLYETFYCLTVEEMQALWEDKEVKGELVFLLEGQMLESASEGEDISAYKELFLSMLNQESFKKAVLSLSEKTGIPKNKLYALALTWKEENNEK